MRMDVSAWATDLMAANPGWVVLPDDRLTMLFALPGHLRGAFWIWDTDPTRLAWRMNEAESLLRKGANAPAGRMPHPHRHNKRHS